MNLYRIITIVLLIITIQSCNQFKSNKNSDRLNEVINTYQDHEGYDSKKYPLGLVTKEHYKNEADFANELLLGLSLIDTTYLDDNDKILIFMSAFMKKGTKRLRPIIINHIS